MKIIITGVTGFIGGYVLKEAIADSEITHIYTLSRKPIAESLSSNPKVTAIIHKDFSVYSPEVLKQLEGAEACIWMLGTARPTSDPRPIDIGFTQAASQAFTNFLSPSIPGSRKFRFIHTSGILSEKDQSKSLWFVAEGRHSRGESETKLLEFAKKNEGAYEGIVARPGLVLRRGIVSRIWLKLTRDWCIEVESLARAMVGLAKVGNVGGSGLVENKVLIELGKRA